MPRPPAPRPRLRWPPARPARRRRRRPSARRPASAVRRHPQTARAIRCARPPWRRRRGRRRNWDVAARWTSSSGASTHAAGAVMNASAATRRTPAGPVSSTLPRRRRPARRARSPRGGEHEGRRRACRGCGPAARPPCGGGEREAGQRAGELLDDLGVGDVPAPRAHEAAAAGLPSPPATRRGRAAWPPPLRGSARSGHPCHRPRRSAAGWAARAASAASSCGGQDGQAHPNLLDPRRGVAVCAARGRSLACPAGCDWASTQPAA